MARKYVDCREMPSESNCSVALSADTDQELLEAAVQHAVAVHGFKDETFDFVHQGMSSCRAMRI